MKVKKTISIHDFWNDKHDIITIEVEGGIGESVHLNTEHELERLGYKLNNINYMDITYSKTTINYISSYIGGNKWTKK